MEFVSVTEICCAEVVETLACEIWIEYYTPIIGRAQVVYMLEKFQTAQAVLHQIACEGYLYYLLCDGSGVWVGYFAVIPKEAELFLSKFYILAQCRGCGYGREAIQFIETLARRQRLPKIALAVYKNNTHSINIYRKLGFDITGPLVADIGGGFLMDDYRMEKTVLQGGEKGFTNGRY